MEMATPPSEQWMVNPVLNTYNKNSSHNIVMTKWIGVIIALMALAVGVMATVCQADAMYGNLYSIQNNTTPICKEFVQFLPHYNHTNFQSQPFMKSELKSTFSLIVIPIFITSIVILLMNVCNCQSTFSFTKIKRRNLNKLWNKITSSWTCYKIRSGDPKEKIWCIVIIILPTVLICVMSTLHYKFTPEQKERMDGLSESMIKWFQAGTGLAKSTGYAAVISLVYFMIPVSKQSPLLAAFGWSPIQALSIHIWAGRTCFVCTLLHAGLFSCEYGLDGLQDGKSFARAVINALIPPKHCFRWGGIWSYKYEAEINEGCYGYLRNFTGLISTIALVLLMLSSLNCIRRRSYRFFYISHILTGWTMLLFAILHFRYIGLYILPSILYYLCTTSPIVIQMIASYWLDEGCRLESFSLLKKSNGCMELCFPKSVTCAILERQQAAPYVRICIPEFSLLWYPFTVASTPKDKDTKLKILFRKYGYFTSKLYHRLEEQEHNSQRRRPLPIILVDGYYFGHDWVDAASMLHDEILIIAGGIAITPFLSMIRMLHDKILSSVDANQSDNDDTEKSIQLSTIQLHWFCRDEGLIRHVILNYFSHFCNWHDNNTGGFGKASEQNSHNTLPLCEVLCSIQIMIHFTKRGVDNLTPFSLVETNKEEEEEPPTEATSILSSPLSHINSNSSLETVSDHLLEPESNNSQEPIIATIAIGNNSGTTAKLSPHGQDSKVDNGGGGSRGCKVEAARFSLGTNDSQAYLWLFSFTIIFVIGLTIHAYIYTMVQPHYPSAIAFRAYSTYAVISWSILVGLIMECISRCYCKRKVSHQLLEQSNDVNEVRIEDGRQIAATITTTAKEAEDLRLPFSGEKILGSVEGRKVATFKMNVQNGRPLLDDVVDGIIRAERPGAFFCGPSRLLKDVQQHINNGRRAFKGRGYASQCCMYQENFEM